MRTMNLLLLALASTILAACVAPAARTPSHPEVLAVLVPGGSFVNVGPGPNGDFAILPGALPSGGYQLYFDALYPTHLRVTLDGVNLPRQEDIPAGADPALTGWFKVTDTNINLTPPKWHVSIRPPTAKLGAPAHELNIFDVSDNPNFAVGTPDHESAPLVLRLVRRPTHVLTVLSAGSGSGTIRSDLPGIDCGIDCREDYGQSQTITLTPHLDADTRFVGWAANCPAPSSCNCSGTNGACMVTLNDAVSVTATFAKRAVSPGPVQSCPGPRSDPSLIYVGQPSCATGIADQHPTASMACDAQGFFCCESVTGANEPRCGGGDRRQFPADCLAYSPNGGPPPNGLLDGCYRRN